MTSKFAHPNTKGRNRTLVSPIPSERIIRARLNHLATLCDRLTAEDVAALFLQNPVNTRYAFDCSNLAVWTPLYPVRYGLIPNGDPAILFDLSGTEDSTCDAKGWRNCPYATQRGTAARRWRGPRASLTRQPFRQTPIPAQPDGPHGTPAHQDPEPDPSQSRMPP